MYGWIPKWASKEVPVSLPLIDKNQNKNLNSGNIDDGFNVLDIHMNILGVSDGAVVTFLILVFPVIMCVCSQLQRCAGMMCEVCCETGRSAARLESGMGGGTPVQIQGENYVHRQAAYNPLYRVPMAEETEAS